MLVDPSTSTTSATVTGAIRQASQATGASFDYLLATAQVESGLNPQAGAQTSSARGLFQFIQQTWLATMKQAGPALGYGRYAAAIVKTASGRYEVPDAAMRNEILKLRVDPATNAVMAGAFTRANAAALSARLGRAPSEGELYIAHFLGAGGAAKLISLASSNPHAKADNYFANAAQANTPIFYDRLSGRPRSLAQVRDILTARYDVARSRSDDFSRTAMMQPTTQPQTPSSVPSQRVADPLDLTALASGSRAPRKVPDTAGITGAFAAAAAAPVGAPTPITPTLATATAPAANTNTQPGNDRPIFIGLFQDTDHAAPAATQVSELWTKPLASQDGEGASAEAAKSGNKSGNMFDLFRDPVSRS